MNIRQRIFGEPGLQESPLVTIKKPRGARGDALHSVAVSRQESRRGDTRFGDRYRIVDEAVGVTHASSTYDALLINVCASGAMVSADFEPQPWDRAKLHLDADRPIECKVLWIRDSRIGLEFAQPIELECTESAQAAVLRQVITRHFPGARFEPAAEPQAKVQESAPEDQRVSRRSPLLRMGTLHYDFKSTPAHLRDISSSGATIETTAALVPGAEPLLDLGEAGSVFATVVWTRGDEAGLRFNQPFDLAQLPKTPAHNEQWRQLPLSNLD